MDRALADGCGRVTASRACGAHPSSVQTRAAESEGMPRGQREQCQMVWPRKAPTRLCAQVQLRPRPQVQALSQQNEATRRDRGGHIRVARTVSSSSVCLNSVVTTRGRKETSRGKLPAPTALSCPCLWPLSPRPSPRGRQQGAPGALRHPTGEATVSGRSWTAAALPSPRTPQTAATKQQCLGQRLLEPSPTSDQFLKDSDHPQQQQSTTQFKNGQRTRTDVPLKETYRRTLRVTQR